jgi:S1-C subfamily serine protease
MADLARAQNAPLTKEEAVLVVDAVVREVFQSARQDRVDYVVQVEVKKSEYGRNPRTPARVVMPAPGDLLYVHTSKTEPESRRVLPAERSRIRAYIVPGAKGAWDGSGSDWFEVTSNELEVAAAGDPTPAAPTPSPTSVPAPASPPAMPRPPAPTGTPAPAGKSALVALGVTGEALSVKGQFVLRVTSVEQGGPAQAAGLQPGDIVIGANEKQLGSIDELDQMTRKGGDLSLIVVDVNSGKAVRVPVSMVAMAEAAAPTTRPVPAPAPIPAPTAPATAARRPLGISAQPVQVGQRTAMKVTKVTQGSPAQEAGIEAGDVIVSANGVAITGPEALSAVIRKAGSNVTLTVRDTRTGKDVPVEVKLGGAEATPAPSVPADSRMPAGSGGKLGAVTELVFYDVDPAVKVTEVEPGSPAARAGLQVGDLIIAADGTPVLHPNTLTEIVSKSGGTLKLVVVDQNTGKKTPIEVSLR